MTGVSIVLLGMTVGLLGTTLALVRIGSELAAIRTLMEARAKQQPPA